VFPLFCAFAPNGPCSSSYLGPLLFASSQSPGLLPGTGRIVLATLQPLLHLLSYCSSPKKKVHGLEIFVPSLAMRTARKRVMSQILLQTESRQSPRFSDLCLGRLHPRISLPSARLNLVLHDPQNVQITQASAINAGRSLFPRACRSFLLRLR